MESWHASGSRVYRFHLPNFTSIGCLAQIENIEEFTDGSLKISITTKERVKVFDVISHSDNMYYAKYNTYDDLPIKDEDQKQTLNIIDEIKEKL